MADGTTDFKGDCGQCNNRGQHYTATATGGMQPGQTATVNGNSPQNCVVANDGGTVYTIQLIDNAGFYDYQVRVEAKGPSGIGSGSMYLAFKDETGDVYYLSIYSSRKEWHTVSYNSSKPNIVAIYWSNYSFTASAAAAAAAGEKPAYQVASPAAPAS
jgi:hypothetical protein